MGGGVGGESGVGEGAERMCYSCYGNGLLLLLLSRYQWQGRRGLASARRHGGCGRR